MAKLTKVNTKNWSQLDFLINNFYEIVEYKRGRGIYGDRVILKRPKNAESVFGEPSKLCEFYYLDANAVKELPMTIELKIRSIARFVTTPEDMNIICNFKNGAYPAEWASETAITLNKIQAEISVLRKVKPEEASDDILFSKLNSSLIERYRLLGDEFIEKLQAHRKTQYFLASNENFNFVTDDYAAEQLNMLENLTRSV